MISRVTGRLERLTSTTAELVVPGGFVLELSTPAYFHRQLESRVGVETTAYTRLLLEGTSQGTSFTPRLLAFPSETDRAFFEVFTSVKGVGPRKAMRALAEPPGVVAACIMGRDLKGLQQLPEIGKRLAETMVAELHGKVDRFAIIDPEARPTSTPSKPVSQRTGPADEAVQTLIALGESLERAGAMVDIAIERLEKQDADNVDAIVRTALTVRVG